MAFFLAREFAFLCLLAIIFEGVMPLLTIATFHLRNLTPTCSMFTPRFQTHSGQYRKEILHPDGSQEGTYGWVDPNNVLRLFDYIADNFGYRIVKESLFKVGTSSLL